MTEQYKSHTPESDRDSWQTPPWLFAALNAEFCFALDAAASSENALCPLHFTILDDSTVQCWRSALADTERKTVYCNPPYSRGSKEKFFAKAVEEKAKGITSVFVVPSLPSEGWFPWGSASEVRFIANGRVSFIHPVTKAEIKGCPAGTCVIIFDPFYKGAQPKVTTLDRNALRAFGETLIEQKGAA